MANQCTSAESILGFVWFNLVNDLNHCTDSSSITDKTVNLNDSLSALQSVKCRHCDPFRGLNAWAFNYPYLTIDYVKHFHAVHVVHDDEE